MAENNEIKTGVALLNYVQEITNITTSLGNAMTEVYTAKTALEGAYIGEAKEEMTMYIGSLYAHIQKMVTLYGSLMTYIYNAYETMEDKDEILSKWILSNWGVEVQVKDGQIVPPSGNAS
ncbi:hypothetical protein [Pseudobutyrivibrio xylanivorans]|uniref:LXG domain of WXG superfamily protein n=1 Tax=Pseudobutyrivibrio xylanivorans TaxID=185007 RepID=A0A5P6VM37_PSEXY|nr:hypothetical protein [Pseudobutyrivibrio xylanivorans]QFJ53723.1 hypothetical protein FXF36_01980 [Pseudobutyrivibrio xylanivorans]